MQKISKMKLWQLAALALIVPAAQAGVVSFDFNSAGTHDVTGTITYDDATNGIVNNMGSPSLGHNITGITGFVSGAGGGTIASLNTNPNQPNVFNTGGYAIDNVLFTAESFLDYWGTYFSLADGSNWNLWGNGDGDYELHSYNAGVDEHGTMTAQVVPEPGTLALLGIGFVGLAFSMKRRSGTPSPFSATPA